MERYQNQKYAISKGLAMLGDAATSDHALVRNVTVPKPKGLKLQAVLDLVLGRVTVRVRYCKWQTNCRARSTRPSRSRFKT